MSRFNNISTIFSNNDSNNSNIIVAIVTNNLSQVKALLNSGNVNSIIDSKNNYTALHYAVTLPNNNITEYILDLGANPKVKQNDGYDAYELSFISGKKYINKYFMDKQEVIINKLQDENQSLLRTKKYQDISINNYNKKINELTDKADLQIYNTIRLEKNVESSNATCLSLKNTMALLVKNNKAIVDENISLKRKCGETELAFINLLKKQKK